MTERPVGGPIVVGVDDSVSARAALRFALEEGVARGVPVVVVTTWIQVGIVRQRVHDEPVVDQAAAVRRRQDELLAGLAAELPEMPRVTQVVRHDAGGAALVEAAKDAAVLVVGSGRRDTTGPTFLGSVSEYCVRHARVPVVVVPTPVPGREYADWLASDQFRDRVR